MPKQNCVPLKLLQSNWSLLYTTAIEKVDWITSHTHAHRQTNNFTHLNANNNRITAKKNSAAIFTQNQQSCGQVAREDYNGGGAALL